jgi:hypothetical protein
VSSGFSFASIDHIIVLSRTMDNPLEPGVAFGAGKAGMGFDAIKFLSTPQVILQSLCLVSNSFERFDFL